LRLQGGGPLLLFGARIDRQHEHGGHDRRSYDAHQVPRAHVHFPNHRASELLAKSSFLAPKRRLDAWLLLEQVASCLAILAVVLCAVA
jgi:hypothetical protein